MAFTTVVGGFEIAGTVGAYLGLGQNMVANNKNESSCLITTSLLQSTVNLLQAFDDLMKFADILTEDESRFMRQTCANVSVELRECRKIPLPKKKLKYFRKNPDYTKQLKRVQALAEASSELTVTVKVFEQRINIIYAICLKDVNANRKLPQMLYSGMLGAKN
ncbi:hypothetical protein E4T56_gene12735 [Termitomyces sp. T112]|nr:hypothetical protein E4T56_gene12735 [Termitomyces sp. T112]KNZ81252.1 hypothetical protein J132_02204 [Termitomyces sp. J132]